MKIRVDKVRTGSYTKKAKIFETIVFGNDAASSNCDINHPGD